MLERFALADRGTDVRTELRGAIATFLTMAYILVANPAILAAAGVPTAPAVACTALAAGLSCVVMGLLSNFPLALASGMGLNAVIAYQVAAQTGGWKTAMGLVVWEGVLVLLLVLLGLREAVLHAIPRDLRLAIGGGIGLFIAFIGLVQAKLVVVPSGTLAVLAKYPAAAMPPVSFGTLRAAEPALALAGLLLTAALLARRVRGALVIGILATTAAALVLGVAHLPRQWAAPDFSIAFQADLLGALRLEYVPLLLSFFMVDFFDTLGTVTAISEQSGLADAEGRVPHLRRILAVDSLGAILGGLLGVSSVTSYIESAAGVAEGARTGLSTIFVGLMFLGCIALAPLFAMVPGAATAPALILVGFLMCAQIARIDFLAYETAIPAFVTLVTLPLTYSIAHGEGYGFIVHVVVMVAIGRARAVHPLLYVTTAAFAAFFAVG
jgi:AGZA family xanthine/uracil permease-like MFS transporter